MQTTSKLTQWIGDLFAPLTQRCYHYVAAPNSIPPYIVWAEDGSDNLLADDSHAEQAISGTIDLYTKKENDPLMDSIERLLDGKGFGWYFNSSQYETETGLLHFEWVFEIGGGAVGNA